MQRTQEEDPPEDAPYPREQRWLRVVLGLFDEVQLIRMPCPCMNPRSESVMLFEVLGDREC